MFFQIKYAVITLIAIISFAPAAGAGATENICIGCHKSTAAKRVIHPALSLGCESCHTAPHTKKKGELSLSAGVPELCSQCHDKTKFTKKNVHPPVAGGDCLTCHNPHSSDAPRLLTQEAPELCFQCHDKTNFTKKNIHPPVAGGDCLTCHNPHSSDARRLLTQEVPELCFQCHDKTNFMKKNVHPPVAGGDCLACHNPHSSDARRLLTQEVPLVCQTCHPDKTDGKHILGGYGFGDNHPIQGHPDPSRKGRELGCTSCHGPHSSGKNKLLVNDEPGSSEILCLVCHTKIIVRP